MLSLLPVLFWSCASGQLPAPVETLGSLPFATDTAIFAMAVRAINRGGATVLQVAPRPLRADSQTAGFADEHDLANVPEAVVR